ncbi:BURP domain protein RD22, partial [Mucuna pruriens]
MEYRLLPIFTLLSLALVATHAALPPEVYWKSVLPTTPMPKAIAHTLYPGEKVSVSRRHKENPIQPSDHTNYKHGAAESELRDEAPKNEALFFLEKDLRPGTKLDLHFTRSSNEATFLPRQVADSIPFSSNKLDHVFTKFSIKPGSEESRMVMSTINECEEAGIKGEEKYCATSLESMIDFITSKIGKSVEALSTEVEKETGLQKHSVTPGVKKFAGDKAVVCHKQNYPYAVFYCHKIGTARAYSVPLVAANGVRVKAVAVCHTDTSQWNPKHLAFYVLKVKPGTVPICHFLREDNVVWVNN